MLSNYKIFKLGKVSICYRMMFILFTFSFYLASAQDHAIDLGFIYTKDQLIFQDGSTDYSFDTYGPVLSYTGYLGLLKATELRVGYVTTQLEITDFRGDVREISATGLYFGYHNRAFSSEEVYGFSISYGSDFLLNEDIFKFAPTLSVGYRFIFSERFSLEPSLQGGLGFVFFRGDLDPFDGGLSGSYGGLLRAGYVF